MSRADAARRAVPWVFLFVMACEVIGGFEEFEAAATAPDGPGGAGAPGTGADAASEGCPEGAMPGSAGPPMIRAMRADGSCYWIDRTEVSRSQYEAFVAAAMGPSLQPAYCQWNIDFTTADCDGEASTKPSTGPEQPITCVDQCDAAAFCAFAGKRLCAGRAGAAATNAEVSEWFAACSNRGLTQYPYGNTYDADACNGADRRDTGCSGGSCQTVDTGVLLTCDTEDSVSDLSGNVAEWTSECNAQSGARDACTVRGGSVRDNGGLVQCSSIVSLDRSFADAFTGFRCCAD
jgi:formylglycine-generating enzyme